MKQGYKYTWTEMEILKQNWLKLAKEFNGTYKTIHSESFGNFDDPILNKFDLRIPHESGEIFLLTTEFKPLKVSFSFPSKLNTDFLIYPEDFTDKIGKFFGLKEIEIDDYRFDSKYLIKGSNEKLIKLILTKPLKEYLLNNHVSNFKLQTEKQESVLELNIVINELKYDEMNKLIELFKETIELIKSNLPNNA